jgi:hypothetical protein
LNKSLNAYLNVVKTKPNNNSDQVTQNQQHLSQTIGNQMAEKDQSDLINNAEFDSQVAKRKSL